MQTFGQSGYPETSHWLARLYCHWTENSLAITVFYDKVKGTFPVELLGSHWMWFVPLAWVSNALIPWPAREAILNTLCISLNNCHLVGITRICTYHLLTRYPDSLIFFSWHFHSNLGLVRRNGTSSSCSPNRLNVRYQTVLLLSISTYFFQSSYQAILTLSGICYQTIFNTFFRVYISNNTDTFRKILPKILNSFQVYTSIFTKVLKELLPNTKSLY